MHQREQLLRELMGTQVHVVIDRPVGFRHKGLIYPVNYGYIPGIFAGDGEEQDVYILGIAEPIRELDCVVIGASIRRNDVEDKLIAAPAGMHFTMEEMARAIAFQEQYFDHSILVCPMK